MLEKIKNNLKGINFRYSLIPLMRILIILIFLIILTISLKFVYQTINKIFVVKPVISGKNFFDIEKLKKVGPRWGIVIGTEKPQGEPTPTSPLSSTPQPNSFYDVDTFEGGPGSSDDWNLRNKIDPDITSSTAYTGSYSLHMPSSYGRNFENSNFIKSNNFEVGQSASGYNTKDYPYICMAYKIPPETKNNMLIYINGVGWHSITMAQCENPTTYPKVATWNPLFSDDTWHYKCINLDSQLDVSLGAGPHIISAVIWNPGGGCVEVNGEFFIDDFAIAKNPVSDPKEMQ